MVRMKVSGNIVDELSEKIPTYLVAINELIKNSFDARANNVKITFDSQKKTLSILDDGYGMNKSDIETLLHISKSNKEYAKLVNGRYIQGSKGLGFLSVFKFGESVTWKTSTNNSNKGCEFRINYSDIIESENIEDIDIPILEKEGVSRGTLIDICMDEENVLLFKEELDKSQTIARLLHSFDVDKFNDNFNIELEIDNEKYCTNKSSNFHSILPERQLFNVKYKSDNSKVVFYHNNVKAMEYDFTFPYDDFKIDLDLIIFSLKSHDKKKINSLFYDNRNELTPLVYINTNLFNNYTLFDTNVMQKVKYASIMNQIIGNINIYSNNQDLDFNSDRTQFVQNKLTTNITKFIEEINIFIQEKASEYKKDLITLDILTKTNLSNSNIDFSKEKLRELIKSNFKFRDDVDISIDGNKIEYSIFGRKICAYISNSTSTNDGQDKDSDTNPSNPTDDDENDDKDDTYLPAIIELVTKHKKISIPTKQINLYGYIKYAKDSKNLDIDNKEISMKVDDKECITGILKSITKPSSITITYSYLDPHTGPTCNNLTLEFYEPKSDVLGSNTEKELITIPTINSYTIDYNSHVSNLINQINSLNLDEYEEMISCSIRAVFEISVDSLMKTEKFNNLFLNIKKLEDRVYKIIEYIGSNNNLKTKISINAKIDFDSLKNILDKDAYKSIIAEAHLGAHKSTTYISKNDIEELAKKAGTFVVFINEMLKS
ncbi:ATP-binding protein [Tissierella sp. MB52-C2]|uniref:ATP-binding protein n=1 Tax=Tissierella sp. MB52-C2 TaxID=3070999 RepID=UPI00280A9188|nr:ATP-binding protein [Tissierella sp. MB52-C2]WMM25636.1 ATP-binding protein [Tissierella sp. MB52-C2]